MENSVQTYNYILRGISIKAIYIVLQCIYCIFMIVPLWCMKMNAK